jgi:hypothetical protein
VVHTMQDRRPAGPERGDGQDRRGGVWRLVVGLVALGAVVVGVAKVGDLLPSFTNPFGSKTVDRSQPALLQALEDLSEYKAASGNFQVIVDLEKDAKFMPAFLRGQRTLFVGAGSVDAVVDFAGLDQRAIAVSDDRRSVTITLPEPRLTGATVDPQQSHVVSRERGLLDRLGGVFSDSPTSERQLYLMAEERMAAAARESDLRARAEQNTTAMLQAMVRALGFESVTVRFEPSPA